MKVSAKQYASTLYDLTNEKSDSEIDDVIVKLVAYMKKTGDMKKSQDAISQFGDIYNEKHNVSEASVISARILTDEEQLKIQSFIKEKYKSDSVVMNNMVDESIKGGIIIRVGDEILDGSISGRINKLKLSLNK